MEKVRDCRFFQWNRPGRQDARIPTLAVRRAMSAFGISSKCAPFCAQKRCRAAEGRENADGPRREEEETEHPTPNFQRSTSNQESRRMWLSVGRWMLDVHESWVPCLLRVASFRVVCPLAGRRKHATLPHGTNMLMEQTTLHKHGTGNLRIEGWQSVQRAGDVPCGVR